MTLEQLDPRGPSADLAQVSAGGGVGDLLVGDGLEVLADPEAAGVARRAAGGQHMVGADTLSP